MGYASTESEQVKTDYKVEGAGRQWYVWIWHTGDWFWTIHLGPFLTKRRANKVMTKLDRQDYAP